MLGDNAPTISMGSLPGDIHLTTTSGLDTAFRKIISELKFEVE